jgi:shikimate 5-dehydrogenase
MGKRYSWTRVLSAKWTLGATYTSISTKERFGQIPINELIQYYNFSICNEKTGIYALLGDPVDHSLSHITHNKIFRDYQLNALYCKIPVSENEVSAFLEKAKFSFAGFSITRPLKNAVIPGQIINTVYIENCNLQFANTDASSALSLIEEKNLSRNEEIAVIGTGSTAQAITYALFNAGWKKITLLSRNPNKVQRVCFPIKSYESISRFEPLGLIINTTPPCASFSEEFLEKIKALKPIIFDVNYHPSSSQLMKIIDEGFCKSISGIELFSYQAAKQMGFWFNFSFDQQEKIRISIQSMVVNHLQSKESSNLSLQEATLGSDAKDFP